MTTDKHAASFDDDLRRLDNIIAEMGGIAETQLADAIDALVKRDVDAAEKVIKRDQLIDDLEHELDDFATTILALRQPMAEDLRVVIAALKTAAVLERIGDYTKNIAKRAIALSQTPPIGDHATNIAKNVHILVHGEPPERRRRKGDASSYTVVETDTGGENQ